AAAVKATLAKRGLEVGVLHVVRIEADSDEQNVGAVRRGLSIIQDGIVEGVVEGYTEMGLQRRIEAPDLIEARDLGDDVAGPMPVPGAKLVFLGIEVLFLSRHGGRFAQLEPAIDSPEARKRGG